MVVRETPTATGFNKIEHFASTECIEEHRIRELSHLGQAKEWGPFKTKADAVDWCSAICFEHYRNWLTNTDDDSYYCNGGQVIQKTPIVSGELIYGLSNCSILTITTDDSNSCFNATKIAGIADNKVGSYQLKKQCRLPYEVTNYAYYLCTSQGRCSVVPSSFLRIGLFKCLNTAKSIQVEDMTTIAAGEQTPEGYDLFDKATLAVNKFLQDNSYPNSVEISFPELFAKYVGLNWLASRLDGQVFNPKRVRFHYHCKDPKDIPYVITGPRTRPAQHPPDSITRSCKNWYYAFDSQVNATFDSCTPFHTQMVSNEFRCRANCLAYQLNFYNNKKFSYPGHTCRATRSTKMSNDFRYECKYYDWPPADKPTQYRVNTCIIGDSSDQRPTMLHILKAQCYEATNSSQTNLGRNISDMKLEPEELPALIHGQWPWVPKSRCLNGHEAFTSVGKNRTLSCFDNFIYNSINVTDMLGSEYQESSHKYLCATRCLRHLYESFQNQSGQLPKMLTHEDVPSSTIKYEMRPCRSFMMLSTEQSTQHFCYLYHFKGNDDICLNLEQFTKEKHSHYLFYADLLETFILKRECYEPEGAVVLQKKKEPTKLPKPVVLPTPTITPEYNADCQAATVEQFYKDTTALEKLENNVFETNGNFLLKCRSYYEMKKSGNIETDRINCLKTCFLDLWSHFTGERSRKPCRAVTVFEENEAIECWYYSWLRNKRTEQCGDPILSYESTAQLYTLRETCYEPESASEGHEIQTRPRPSRFSREWCQIQMKTYFVSQPCSDTMLKCSKILNDDKLKVERMSLEWCQGIIHIYGICKPKCKLVIRCTKILEKTAVKYSKQWCERKMQTIGKSRPLSPCVKVCASVYQGKIEGLHEKYSLSWCRDKLESFGTSKPNLKSVKKCRSQLSEARYTPQWCQEKVNLLGISKPDLMCVQKCRRILGAKYTEKWCRRIVDAHGRKKPQLGCVTKCKHDIL